MTVVTYHSIPLPSGVNIHYATSEPSSPKFPKPRTVLLLHGFPTSSHQYRFLIPRLSDLGYTVLAPDLPGFGSTTVPDDFGWTFANLAEAIGHWIDSLGLTEFSAYIFDYGAPVFFRLFESHETRYKVKSIVTQNGNLYEEGLGMPWWANRRRWWAEGQVDSAAFRAQNHALLKQPLKVQYTAGTPRDRLNRLDPMTWVSDYKLNIQGNEERLLDLFFDYGDNVRLYPQWQTWLKSREIPILAMWGKNDPSFVWPGAEAIKRDIPDTELIYLDGGHFVLETHLDEAIEAMTTFFDRVQ